ncbi:MAG: Stp1/IreP family PP2C-type Ser/Thr phosphatase [Limosilactobacillus gorillae]|jgi:PPM family protein phosphatase|uniref:Stp1/IreP family PP2C-type Ser/Thr phosphatase n=1 Tax=Limosilactobacillus gorillae TaxID=1450649 RepID=UPI000B33368E|nr:Stp1/IreP family PP2C-type Ser/Thr phosphatase [Limosilactobacillus gorillae]MDO4855365.1 Stp1/IreP family PP2C-type Ser/Thr phosphatase [Limosilactobacillus gorillae]
METAFRSDIGQQRSQNQDRVSAFCITPNLQLVVIADGVGGNNGGNVAAEETVMALGRYFTQEAPKTSEAAKEWFREKVRLVNQLILKKSQSNPKYRGMGTTMVAAILIDSVAVVANIGDSRGYIFHQDLLTQITDDHSLVNELVKNGDLTEQEAAHSPQNNIITRAIGISNDAEIDVNVFQLGPKDQLLLCTDGLTKMVPAAQITTILAGKGSLTDKCAGLIKLANEAGGSDNVTVLISQNDQEK